MLLRVRNDVRAECIELSKVVSNTESVIFVLMRGRESVVDAF